MPDDPKPATPTPTPPAGEAPAIPATPPAAPPVIPGTPSTPPAPTSPAGDTPTPSAELPKVPSAPEKYELKLPDKSTLDGALVDRTAAFAKARGLSQEAAQSVLDHAASEVTKTWQDADAQFKAQVDSWKQLTDADPSLGKTREERVAAVTRGKQVLEKYEVAHPERGAALRKFLNETGYGEHPAVVGWFAYLGSALKEPPVLTPAPTTGQVTEREALEKMFPNSPELFKKTA